MVKILQISGYIPQCKCGLSIWIFLRCGLR